MFVPDDNAIRTHPRFGLPTRYISISKDPVAVNAIKKAQKLMEVRAEILATGGISPKLMPKAQLANERFIKALEAIDAELAAQAKAEDDDTLE